MADLSTTIDYSQVAARYERNPVRRWIPRDPRITGKPRLLDLACGTGLYLEAQVSQCGVDAAVWHGVDASEAMLAVARGKGLPAELRQARAEALPYADASFDYVVCRFAFHHFVDKEAALREMVRVLAPGGTIRYENLAPEFSANWWLFRYWPAAVVLDERRFWRVAAIESALAAHGLATHAVPRGMGNITAGHILTEARNRETSELNMLDDATYAEGLAALERDLAGSPERLVESGLFLADVIATAR